MIAVYISRIQWLAVTDRILLVAEGFTVTELSNFLDVEIELGMH